MSRPTAVMQTRRPAQAMLRMGHVFAFRRFLEEAGMPAERLLRQHGLPVLSEEAGTFVPVPRVWSLLDTVSRREDPLFAWRCGARAGDRPIENRLREALESSATLYEALRRFSTLIHAEATHLELKLRVRGNDVHVCVSYPGMQELPGYGVAQGYQIQVVLDLARHFLGEGWQPSDVGIESTRAPEHIEELLPGTRIIAGQDCGYIAIPRDHLYRPVQDSRRRNMPDIDSAFRTEFDFQDALKALVSAYLPDGYPPASFAAELVGISDRTLERRLADRGSSYRQLIDEVRLEKAQRLLLEGGPSIGEIASVVGFNDQRNFARMFRRMTGLSPREFRRQTH